MSAGQCPASHDFVVLRVNVVVVLTENVRVLHIRRRAFQTVQAQQTQAEDVLANGGFVFIRVNSAA